MVQSIFKIKIRKVPRVRSLKNTLKKTNRETLLKNTVKKDYCGDLLKLKNSTLSLILIKKQYFKSYFEEVQSIFQLKVSISLSVYSFLVNSILM